MDASRGPWCVAPHAAEKRCPERLVLVPVSNGTGNQSGECSAVPSPTHSKKILILEQGPGSWWGGGRPVSPEQRAPPGTAAVPLRLGPTRLLEPPTVGAQHTFSFVVMKFIDELTV